MQEAVAKEGPRAPLFCLSTAILLAVSVFASAQVVEQSDLEICASQETAELKLACFEAISSAASRVAGPAADKTIPDTNVADEIAADENAAAGRILDDSSVGEPVVDRAVIAETRADELGSEHLNEDKIAKENSDARLTVSKVVKGGYDVLYFHLTNGQVWRQLESRQFNYPRNGEFEVIISRGMMGDYRLRLNEKSPMTTIRRIQ